MPPPPPVKETATKAQRWFDLKRNRLLRLLQDETDIKLRDLFVMFLIIGVSNALVLVVVHAVSEAHSRQGAGFQLLLFLVFCAATQCYTKKIVNTRLTVHLHEAIFKLRVRILNKLRRSRLLSFERLERSQLINALSENTMTIIEGTKHFEQGVPAGVLLVAASFYVAVLSWTAFWMMATCIAACGFVLYRLSKAMAADLRASMQKEDEFFESFHHLLDGFKELKMSHKKNDDLFENYLMRISQEARLLNTKTAMNTFASEYYTYVFFYILLAGTLFLLPRLGAISPQETVSITTIILFLIGNVSVFAVALPSITKTDVAIENIARLEQVLNDVEASLDALPPSPLQTKSSFEQITVKNVYFTYAATNHKPFSVELGELIIRRGEMLFIQGGNGTGKSTLLKLVTGLYRPQKGTLLVDQIPVTEENVAHYRELFSIIFTDFHLFDRLYGQSEVDDKKVTQLLLEMQLEQKTNYVDGKFRNLNLSTGQKKRLALIIALLEDRPIYVFDELAADQDPEFRKYIYEVLLQNLKNQGKTIIMATHDDRYFHFANRVLKMEYGRVVSESHPSRPGQESHPA